MELTITDAELELMKLLWRENPLTAREITQRLLPHKQWHRKTVNTLLSRLEKKSAISVDREKDGVNYFSPLVAETTYMQSATSHFVDRLFGGNIAPLLASFAESRPLDSDQVSVLQDLLKDLSDDH